MEVLWINTISSTGESCPFRSSARSKVDEFKDMLARNSFARYKENEMKLIYKGEIMEDDRTLDSYGIKSNHTIYVEGAQDLVFDTADTITDLPDTSQLIPVITMMMESLLSSSLYMKQIIGQNPQLQIIFDSDPQLKAMTQSPEPQEFWRITSPQMMQAPESQLEPFRQNSIGHSIPSEDTVAGPSASSNVMDPGNEYEKLFEVAAKAPESQLDLLRQNSIGHSIPSEYTVAGPSTSFNAMDPGNELYEKSFEVAAKAPESQLEPFRQNSIGHSIPLEDTVASPSASSNVMGLQPQRSSDRKYEIFGWVIFFGIVAWGISKRP